MLNGMAGTALGAKVREQAVREQDCLWFASKLAPTGEQRGNCL